jgi:DNA-binding NtrC family response regulator
VKPESGETYVNAPALPANYVDRPEALQSLREAVLRNDSRSIALTALQGMGGIGKSVLAQALCRDAAVQQSFPDGIIWITAGKESDYDLITRLREVGKALKDDLSRYAQGGTVFFDEIGEMSAALQPKLLRVIQNRELQRVGGTQTIPLDVRVIAATNRDLQAAVRKGAFREDLFYRLSVITLRTPPLRERSEDILPLAQHFARRFGTKCGRRSLEISANACRLLQTYDWPGNVRELENAIEHAAVLGSGEMILPEDLPETLLERWAEESPREGGTLQHAVNSAKRAAVKRAFEVAGQDHVEAARLLGVHPNYLYRLIKNLSLQVS